MKNHSMIKSIKLIICFVLFTNLSVSGQYFEMGFGFGGALYYGDLSPDKPMDNFKMIRPAIGVYATHHFNKKFSVRLDVQNLTLAGDDKLNGHLEVGKRNLSFKSNVWELGLKGQYNLIGFDPDDDFWAVFISSGITVLRHDPKAYYFGSYYRLQPLSTEGQGLTADASDPYKLIQIAIPIVLGAKYAINEYFNIFIEFGPRITFTDYLDDVSANYADESTLREAKGDIAVKLSYRRPELGEPTAYPSLLQRGNKNSKDLYFGGLVGLSINMDDIMGNWLGPKVRCPKF